jgi:hypothetical protein
MRKATHVIGAAKCQKRSTALTAAIARAHLLSRPARPSLEPADLAGFQKDDRGLHARDGADRHPELRETRREPGGWNAVRKSRLAKCARQAGAPACW